MNLENLRHSTAHLLAAAVLELWPHARPTLGPPIEDGFYYDFDFSGFAGAETRGPKDADKRGKSISEEDLSRIEEKMRELLPAWEEFEQKEVNAQEARETFANNPYKRELIDELEEKGEAITLYTSGGFTDLCRGGHVDNPAEEINPDAFKLTHLAGAYWRGDENNPMLTRIYGTAFPTKKELTDHLARLEEAKKRDHRVLGKRLKIFTLAEEVGPGLPLWLPYGTVIREELEKYAKQVEKEWGYKRVATPHIAKEDLYKMSGHIPYYQDDMYPPMKLDDGNYYLKAMNCPHTHMIYRAEPKSYRDLPLRLAEYGTVYRYERSGTLAGLLRVRGFTQNDAHVYCREDQVIEEFLTVMRLHEFWYKDVFGLEDFYMRLSLPEQDSKKYAGMPEGWKKSVALLREAMEQSGLPYKEAEGEAAFYGPKVDFQIKSVIGREETASTNQLDFLATERFDLTYIDRDGEEKPVYVIHRAPLGSHERFIAFLIEHYAGAFPVWLAPVQVRIIPVSEKHTGKAQTMKERLEAQDVRVEVDAADETVGKRIREAELMKIPYIAVVGDKESENELTVRERETDEQKTVTLSALTEEIHDNHPSSKAGSDPA